MKGKGSALGVGRGRAVAMRARVSYTFLTISDFCYDILQAVYLSVKISLK